MRNSDFTEDIQYTEDSNSQQKRPRSRRREVLWFNPPWNAAVSTNVAARFLKLIDKHFDKQSPFHKNFNRQTVKVSYSCMPNMASIISSHNRRVTGAVEEHVEGGCNCRNSQTSCVLQGFQMWSTSVQSPRTRSAKSTLAQGHVSAETLVVFFFILLSTPLSSSYLSSSLS